MGMVVRTNTMANNAFRQLGMNNSALSKSLEKLSSGFRINRAGDDAAGLAVSEKMKAQITGLESASANAEDGISLVQTAEGALNEVHDMLNRMTELATKASNGTYTGTQRQYYQDEVDALCEEIDRISKTTEFNGQKLLDGTAGVANASVKGVFGSTELTFSAKSATLYGAASKINISAVAANDAGVTVTFDTDGINVSLGSKAATSYTTSEIKQAILNAAQREKVKVEGNGTSDLGTATTIDAAISNLQSLDITIGGQSGTIHLSANDAFSTGDKALVAGTGTGGVIKLQVGASGADDQIDVTITKIDSIELTVDTIDITTVAGATSALSNINTAIEKVSKTRSDLGAVQNRLEHTINNLDTTAENLDAANSRIRDTDMAKEMMEYTKMSVLAQSAQAMLAQANQQPQAVLQLLQ